MATGSISASERMTKKRFFFFMFILLFFTDILYSFTCSKYSNCTLINCCRSRSNNLGLVPVTLSISYHKSFLAHFQFAHCDRHICRLFPLLLYFQLSNEDIQFLQ